VTVHVAEPASNWLCDKPPAGFTTLQVILAVPAAEGSSTSGVAGAREDGNALVQVPKVASPVRVMLPMLIRTLLLAALIVSALVHVNVPPVSHNR
jgi:hypothetical protein